ncbi:NAD(P)H-dependent amine dehydrogenase family protein [Zhongshania aquimaris]|uniref:2,4-diaminopentanoate dehydrogenase C-terminal domain-containing protein n=1 Tax=Zhongshania aquimaris TaxID=2857107 RepID=A0ABS6VYC3_9GAMM|nr:hypothetical protein [Zhongshania aquimaris]MBW2942685.1 hypothetical protein [Zhongshania aquimaris]
MTNTEQAPVRIVQWTTGKVATQAIKAILERPNMDLVGLYAFSANKVGQDVGDLCGLGRKIGVLATSDIDELLALKPDCVAYMPLHPNVDHMEKILRAGVNIATTASFLTGRGYGEEARSRLEAAAQAGNASLFGSGINPGWIDAVVATASSLSRDVNLVRVTESFNIGMWSEDANQNELGWGRPAGDTGHAAAIEKATLPFGDAVEAIAKMFKFKLDDIRCDVEFAHATEDADVPGRDVRKGTVAGILARWRGIADGHPVIELNAQWTVAQDIEPAWQIFDSYQIEILGNPNVKLQAQVLPEDMSLPMDELLATGHIITASPVVNAIPSVVAARPGIVTYADLKPVTSVIVPKAIAIPPLPLQELDAIDESSVIGGGVPTLESVAGSWAVSIKGPTGAQETRLDLRVENGVLVGEQSAAGDIAPVSDVCLEGNQLSWVNVVTKPLKMKVRFNGIVDGNKIAGKVKPGIIGKFPFVANKL